MADGFTIGDVVRLKSGGPLMTVIKLTRMDEGPSIKCTWFADMKTAEDYFPPDALEKQ